MRVTESSIASSFLNNVNETRERISQEQTELATGKSVNTVSDNPQATSTILQLKSLISDNTQFQQNNTEAQSQAQATESALNSFTNIMVNLKGIVAQATNGSLSSEDQQTYADQVGQLLEQAVDLANTQSNGSAHFRRHEYASTALHACIGRFFSHGKPERDHRVDSSSCQ